jgi:hypothetical protein
MTGRALFTKPLYDRQATALNFTSNLRFHVFHRNCAWDRGVTQNKANGVSLCKSAVQG